MKVFIHLHHLIPELGALKSGTADQNMFPWTSHVVWPYHSMVTLD